MFCKNCGANAPDGANNCPACGASLGDAYFSGGMDLDGGSCASTAVPKAEPVTGYDQNVKINMGGRTVQSESHTGEPQKRFCTYCGATMTPGSRYCISCGKENGSAASDVWKGVKDTVGGGISKVGDMMGDVVQKKGKKGLFIILGSAAALLTALIIVIVCWSIRSPEEVVEEYIEASMECDVEAILDLVPEDVLDYELEDKGIDDDEFEDFCEEAEEKMRDGLEDIADQIGDDWEYSYEIVEEEDVSRKKLRDIQEEYEDEFDVVVKDAKTVKVELTITGEDFENTVSKKLSLIKVGSSWYLDIDAMGSLF